MADESPLTHLMKELITLAQFPSLLQQQTESRDDFLIRLIGDIVSALRALEELSSRRELAVLSYLNAQRRGDRLDDKDAKIILRDRDMVLDDFNQLLRRLMERKFELEGKSIQEISDAFDAIETEEPDWPYQEALKHQARSNLEELLLS
jgi:hypothetical protein